MRKVAQIMGMPISVDIPSAEEAPFETVFKRLRAIDDKFSPFKENSHLNLYNTGQLSRPDKEFQMIIEACRDASEITGGLFSAWATGIFDPSGYVKGWAIAEAGKIIEAAGYKTFCIGAGGDILARSIAEEWVIGIQNPFDKSRVIGSLNGQNFAVATSGNYHRGKHIFNPETGEPADDLASISVVGEDIIKADILATASFVAGDKSLDFIAKNPDYEALVVDKQGKLAATAGLAKILGI